MYRLLANLAFTNPSVCHFLCAPRNPHFRRAPRELPESILKPPGIYIVKHSRQKDAASCSSAPVPGEGNVFMAFEPNPLSPSITWDNVGDNVSSMIFGRGQTVFWKGSNVTVYEKNSDGTDQITQLKGWPDGQGLISPGTKLYVTNGKVQEG